ncbi:hypothetical protein OH738_18130 [Streptomyces hirsutus]|uniref:hypothetical protein n=1 Tax=Streptomyces hirsutus TaxID=35620 RepID=UPI00386E34DD|nr:hypothetical protein OH738_18130 [Streptomyces hirsutus]
MPLDLATAQAELDDARAILATLQEQVRNGNQDITPQQLADQRELIAFAELRITAAERAERAAAAEALTARAEAVGARARTLVEEDSTEPITTAVRAVIASVRDLLTAAADRHATIHEVAVEGVRLNEELGRSDNDAWPSRAYGFMAQTHPTASVTAMGAGRAEAVAAHRLLVVAIAAALEDQAGMRSQVARELTGTRDGLAHLAQLTPGVAEALRDGEG